MKTQVDAIKNLKIDKVTVWDGGQNQGDGNATSKFVSGLYKSIPPLQDLFTMAGMDLPTYLGKQTNGSTESNLADAPKEPVKNGTIEIIEADENTSAQT